MTNPVEALKRAISAPLIVTQKQEEDARNLFMLHNRISWFAGLDGDTYQTCYLAVAMEANIDFSVPSQELFTAAEKVCDGFLQGFIPPSQLEHLKKLIKDESSKLDTVLMKQGRAPENYVYPLTHADSMLGARLPDRYLKIITPYLNMHGHVNEQNFPLKIRENMMHGIQGLNDMLRFRL